MSTQDGGPMIRLTLKNGRLVALNAMMVDSVRPNNQTTRVTMTSGKVWVVTEDVEDVLTWVTQAWHASRCIDTSYRLNTIVR